ncbi:MAG TPA: cell wall-binding repeat-containing protein, partial [Solirubrobacteraceae bacterium]|nr:cell wall-binding repeat-containing protein [Solirubrobacteraceae bacterium]
MPRRLLATLAALAVPAVAMPGCGGGADLSNGPTLGQQGKDEKASVALGFPGFATKNTTRVGGADPTADAAGVALAVFSGGAAAQRPRAVALVDSDDWASAIAASVFMSPPIRAPVLLTQGGDMPKATSDALDSLHPTGSRAAAGAQVIRVGAAAKPGDRKVVEVGGRNPFAIAREIDRLQSAAAGKTSDRVIIASAEQPEYAMPAAAWAAKGGDPVLYVRRDSIPSETVAALKAHQQPKIYVLGPPDVISPRVMSGLRRLGTVRRIAGRGPVATSIAFARFVDGAFGWGVVDPGHG